MGRTADRRDQSSEVRIVWLEADADDFESDLSLLDSRISRILWTMVGLLVSIATAATLLALNLVTRL